MLAIDKLALARVIGLPPGQAFVVTDEVPHTPLETITVEDAVARARHASRLSAGPRATARRGADAPIDGGRQLSIALGGRQRRHDRQPEFRQRASHLHRRHLPADPDLPTGRGCSPIRCARMRPSRVSAPSSPTSKGRSTIRCATAFLMLRASADLVTVARSNVTLADQTLTQAQHRFTAGVADNLEVVQAQESVAAAHTAAIESLHSYNLAKLSRAGTRRGRVVRAHALGAK